MPGRLYPQGTNRATEGKVTEEGQPSGLPYTSPQQAPKQATHRTGTAGMKNSQRGQTCLQRTPHKQPVHRTKIGHTGIAILFGIRRPGGFATPPTHRTKTGQPSRIGLPVQAAPRHGTLMHAVEMQNLGQAGHAAHLQRAQQEFIIPRPGAERAKTDALRKVPTHHSGVETHGHIKFSISPDVLLLI